MSERHEMKLAWNRRARKDAFRYVETKFWDSDVDRFFALGEERTRLLIDPILDKYKIVGTGSTAVDVGCGVGRFTRALARRFDRVIGIDVSDEMVVRARVNLPVGSKIEFLASDGVSLPQEANSADFVWSYEVFQHMPSHDIVMGNLREVQRILKPTGIGLLHFRSAHEYPTSIWYIAAVVPPSLISIMKRMLGKDPLTADRSWRGAAPLSKREIERMCTISGLTVVELLDDPTHKLGTRVFAVVRAQNGVGFTDDI